MSDGTRQEQHAQVGDIHMETWIDDGHYFWSVTNAKTHQQIGIGEADSLDAAKVAASVSAGVHREGHITWRGPGFS